MKTMSPLSSYSKKKRTVAGFTLLELLVVISIIGLLIAMGTVAFTTAQRKGRDSKRRSDMQQMQKAFEQYYAENGSYDTCGTMAASMMPGGLPSDPQPVPTAPYNTGTGCDATAYCVCALLEDTGTGNAGAPTGVNCAYAGGGDYYCASNLQ